MDEDIDAINVVPLVDVMLVLLTIVLTTATFIATGRIPVDLAEARHAPSRQESPLVLTLTMERRIYLDDRPVADLSGALVAASRASPVLVRADGGLELKAFVDLVDRVKALGFQKVSLEVRRR
jgi:biopolymer transport protein ExbD